MNNRKHTIANLKDTHYDLFIIGGGVTGAGIALDAASRGLKVALADKGDFASGTSSKSTKLIHGGLRYLKQLDIGLVHETGTERAVVHRIAPHLCLPEKMLLPLTKNGTHGRRSTSFGLYVYDWLAGVDGDDRRQMLSKDEALKLEPLLNEESVIGAGYYAEYRTDDARLTIELIKKAASYGAVVVNYAEVTDFIYDKGKIAGVRIIDKFDEDLTDVKSHFVVNATGPWVDHLRGLNDSLTDKHLVLTKGVHIVIARDRFPIQQSIYFDEPLGRMIFAIPRGKITYVGTTDTTYKGSMDRIVTTKADRDYLLQAVNATFPTLQLQATDILSSWAGLRPLIYEKGKNPGELSRKDEIFVADDGLISITGGKLTGYRKMAERVVDIVAENGRKIWRQKIDDTNTHNIPLASDRILTQKDIEDMVTTLSTRHLDKGINEEAVRYLVTSYGQNAQEIIDSLPADSDVVDLAVSELKYGIDHEFVIRAEDYFVRRSGRLYFDIDSIPAIMDAVIKVLAQRFGWDKKRIDQEMERMKQLIIEATTFYDE